MSAALSILKFPLHIIKSGVNNENLLDKQKRMIMLVNSVSLTLAFLIIVLGTLFYFYTGSQTLAYSAGFEFFLAVGAIVLNKQKKYTSAAMLIYITQCASCAYFGCLLSPAIELQSMVIFLICLIGLFFTSHKHRRMALMLALTSLAYVELALHVKVIPPLVTPISMEYGTQVLIREVTMLGLMSLVIIVVRPYVLFEQKNKFLTLFYSGIIHDIRQVLQTSVTATTLGDKMNLDKVKSFSDLKNLLKTTSIAHKEGLALTENSLSIFEIENGIHHKPQKSKVQIHDFLIGTIDHQRNVADFAKKKIVLDYGGTEEASVNIDETALRRIFNNLLSNAIKYSNKHSTINVKIITITPNLTIEVRNQGQPLSEAAKKKLFLPFNKDSRYEHSSTGLGLSIVNYFIKAAEGKLSSYQDKDDYSFTFSLPTTLNSVPALSTALMRKTTQTISNNYQLPDNLKIVLMEDDALNRRSLEADFILEGWTFYVATDFRTFDQICDHVIPDFFIIDYHMNDFGGGSSESLVHKLSKDPRLKNVPIIIISGDVSAKFTIEKHRDKINAFLNKPFTIDDLKNQLLKILFSRNGLDKKN